MSEEQIVRLLHLVDAMNRKVDALTDCVVSFSRQLDSVEERLFAQVLAKPAITEKMERVAEELDSLEAERASQRLPANAVSADELAALLNARHER